MPMESLPLRDIHLPDPIGWWPLAPGWWGLLVLLTLLIGILVYVIRRRRRVTPIKLALAELTRLEANADLSAREQLETLSILMRRVAMTICPREDVAGRAGEDWLNWLNNATGTAHFEGELGRLLISGSYSEDPSASLVAELLTTYRKWLMAMGNTQGR
jgi:hypothetical protein